MNDTIAAIVTAPGPAGVCVVRISGPDALQVVDRLTPLTSHKPSQRAAGTFFYADIIHPQTHEKIDDTLILVFHAPRSFTGEEVVEIQGHGGTWPSQRLLDAVLAAGARMAEAGEFSKRAFLNGRLDLTQAEAICDFIQSKSARMAQAARAQLDGQLGSRLTALYEALLAHCSDIEHQLDFDEGDLSNTFLSETTQALQQTMIPLAQMIHAWNTQGHILRDGALVVLSGKPNAGKSSLLNALLGRNRAIVHHVPGTTRDVIEESMLMDGVPIRLVDTAGLRISTDDVEQEGIARTRALIKQADVNLQLIDVVTGTDDDLSALSQDARSLVIFTKSDLLVASVPFQQGDKALMVSAQTGQGLELLVQAILKKLGVVNASAGIDIINQRHAQELRTAYTAAEQAHAELLQRDLVIAANELRRAAEALGRIVGRVYTDDLLESIFSRFCVGK